MINMKVISYQTVQLGENCKKIGSGATPRGGSDVYLPHGSIALIRSQNIYNDGFRKDGLAYISEKHAKELENVVVEPNDILLNITGDSVARCCLVPTDILPARVNQHVAIIRPLENVLDARYLRYYLVSPRMQDQLLMLAGGGATRNALTKGMIESLEVLAPPLPEQRAIAGVLGALDDKIELNRRMNRTLESLARAVFRQWFVESEEVQGWASGFLCDIANVIKGVSYRSVDLVDSSNTALVTLKSMERGGGYREDGLKPYAGEYKAEQKLSPGEVVVAHTDLTQAADVIGKAARIEPSERHPNLVASLDLAIVRPKKNPYTNEYLYGLLSQSEFSDHAFGYTNGTTVLHLSSKALPEYQFKIPPKNKVEEYSELVKPIYRLIDNNKGQSRTLASLRDALLPKLMRGEVRVKA